MEPLELDEKDPTLNSSASTPVTVHPPVESRRASQQDVHMPLPTFNNAASSLRLDDSSLLLDINALPASSSISTNHPNYYNPRLSSSQATTPHHPSLTGKNGASGSVSGGPNNSNLPKEPLKVTDGIYGFFFATTGRKMLVIFLFICLVFVGPILLITGLIPACIEAPEAKLGLNDFHDYGYDKCMNRREGLLISGGLILVIGGGGLLMMLICATCGCCTHLPSYSSIFTCHPDSLPLTQPLSLPSQFTFKEPIRRKQNPPCYWTFCSSSIRISISWIGVFLLILGFILFITSYPKLPHIFITGLFILILTGTCCLFTLARATAKWVDLV